MCSVCCMRVAISKYSINGQKRHIEDREHTISDARVIFPAFFKLHFRFVHIFPIALVLARPQAPWCWPTTCRSWKCMTKEDPQHECCGVVIYNIFMHAIRLLRLRCVAHNMQKLENAGLKETFNMNAVGPLYIIYS